MTTFSREDAFLILNALPKIGWITLNKLLQYFDNDPQAILRGKEDDFKRIAIPAGAIKSLKEWQKLFHFDKEKQHLEKTGAHFISFEHPSYPQLLKTIYDPPIGLYYLGKFYPERNSIAIIGSRYADVYGLQIAERFGIELAERNWTVVGGFARGIDTAAHKGALKAHGYTIAVLGCGLDYIYPCENVDLYAQIKEQGCLVSEFPFGTQVGRMTFPRRNRILSGMTQATLVVESDIKGGSMLTAVLANEQNRQVFAVPGSIDAPMHRGCHHLIRNGATLVTCIDDVLEDLKSAPPLPLQLDLGARVQRVKSGSKPDLNANELQIYELLEEKGALCDAEICELLNLKPEFFQTFIFHLEVNHWIKRRPDGLYELIS